MPASRIGNGAGNVRRAAVGESNGENAREAGSDLAATGPAALGTDSNTR